MSRIRVEYAENASATEVSDVDELKRTLDEIAANVRAELPIIVFIYARGYQVGLGMGAENTFLQFEQESGDPPYIISVGDDIVDGELVFYLLGNHHIEIPRRNLIPTDTALEALFEWIRSGVRSESLSWEEV